MQYLVRDRLIQSKKLKELNIAYPIYIAGWEILQAQNINKLYARIFYKKLINTAKAAKIRLEHISEFGDILQEEIKIINDIDRKPYDFFEVYSLHNDTRKIKVSVIQVLCLDGKSVADAQAIIVPDTFVPFSNEIECAAGQRLIPSAKGYPIEDEKYWVCCCGAVNVKNTINCVQCNFAKRDVIEKITEKSIKETGEVIFAEREAQRDREIQEQEIRKNKRKKRNKLVVVLTVCFVVVITLFCSLYFSLTPFDTVKQSGFTFVKFDDRYQLVSYDGNATEVSIPSTVRGLEVYYIGSDVFSYNYSITEVIIPDSVIIIDVEAFMNCFKLTSVIFENPNGWCTFDFATERKTLLSGEMLSQPFTAANYLAYLYCGCLWQRS